MYIEHGINSFQRLVQFDKNFLIMFQMKVYQLNLYMFAFFLWQQGISRQFHRFAKSLHDATGRMYFLSIKCT